MVVHKNVSYEGKKIDCQTNASNKLLDPHYELVPARCATFFPSGPEAMNTLDYLTLNKSPWPHKQGEPIAEDFAVFINRSCVLREIQAIV